VAPWLDAQSASSSCDAGEGQMKKRVTIVFASTVLMFATFGALVARDTRAAGASNLYCGIVKDNGDSHQIMDGKFNSYWADDEPPKDPKGLESSPLLRKGEGHCLCVEGIINAYQRAGQRAYEFTEVQGLKPCPAAALPGSAAQDDHAWKTYTNERFGFSVCYPSDLLRLEPAPDNNDGQTFTGSNGAKIAAWGSWNATDWTLADSLREDEKSLAGEAGKVTYRVNRGGFYVISGRKGDQIFYKRTALRNGKFSAVELTYPATDSAVWNAISAHVSQCFEPG
jgi:hypothetical protein